MRERKGKILKVRMGYNANSSSISTYVTIFLWGSTAAVTIVNTLSALLFAKDEEKTIDGGADEKELAVEKSTI